MCITGVIYTARDAAHAKMVQALQTNRPLPMELQGALIYYAGPTPAKPGQPVGSLGPTTSGRMDAYAPTLLDRGLKGMMGKGPRSKQVRQAIMDNGAVYFAALFALPALFGARAIFYAEPVSDVLGPAVSAAAYLLFMDKLLQRRQAAAGTRHWQQGQDAGAPVA